MTEEIDSLNARARDWGERLLTLADSLEELALEWKQLPRSTVDDIRAERGVPPETARPPDFMLPHAAKAMEHAAELRSIAKYALEGPFWTDPD